MTIQTKKQTNKQIKTHTIGKLSKQIYNNMVKLGGVYYGRDISFLNDSYT